MSTVKSKKIQLGTSATATDNFTIYTPATPDGTLRIGVGNADSPTEVARFDATGMISGGATPDALSTATGSAPSYSARAWVNFQGTGTVTIRGSGNVTSITDLGTGNYNVNFATAMPDVNYSTVTALNYNNSSFVTNVGATVKLPTTSKIEIETGGSSNNAIDMHTINVAIFR